MKVGSFNHCMSSLVIYLKCSSFCCYSTIVITTNISYNRSKEIIIESMSIENSNLVYSQTSLRSAIYIHHINIRIHFHWNNSMHKYIYYWKFNLTNFVFMLNKAKIGRLNMTFLLDYLMGKQYLRQCFVLIAFVIATKITTITSIRFRAYFFKWKNDDSAFSTTSHHLVDAKIHNV